MEENAAKQDGFLRVLPDPRIRKRRFAGIRWGARISKKFKRCIIHIGTEKTGTSSLQGFFGKNRNKLLQDGIWYPESAGPKGGSQMEFVACVHPSVWTTDIGGFLHINDIASRDKYCETFIRKLDHERRKYPKADTLLVSAEHFQSRLKTPEDIEKLKQFLSPWVERFEVIVYFRRQDRMAVSAFSTTIKSGGIGTKVFPEFQPGSIPYYYDFALISQNWCKVFGRPAVNARIFDEKKFIGGNLITDFSAIAGIDLAHKTVLEQRENLSLSREGIQFMREVNRQNPSIIDGKRNLERDRLAVLISNLSQGRHVGVTKQEAKAFLAQFKDVNDKLRQEYFPNMEEPIFDDDFSDYPDTLESCEPKYEEAVALAVKLWKQAREL